MFDENPVLHLFEEQLYFLEKRIGHHFRDRKYVRWAFTHPSFLHENRKKQKNPTFSQDPGQSYQKLEFLGDSLYNHFLTLKLYDEYPQASEGELSQMRAYLASQKKTAELGRALNLSPLILLGRGERREEGHLKDRIVGDCMEALIGAIFLDLGKRWAALMPLLDQMVDRVPEFFSIPSFRERDVKSALQEYCLKKYKITPVYESVELQSEAQGPYAGKTLFEITLKINNRVVLKTEATNKKQGEEHLARLFFEYGEPESC